MLVLAREEGSVGLHATVHLPCSRSGVHPWRCRWCLARNWALVCLSSSVYFPNVCCLRVILCSTINSLDLIVNYIPSTVTSEPGSAVFKPACC